MSSMLATCRVEHAVRPGSVVLDIGAADGEFTRDAAAAGAVVTAVDPDPANCERCALAGAHLTICGALGASSGRGALSSPFGTGQASFVLDGDSFPVFSFDELVAAAGGRVDVAKLDVEGAEYPALLGSECVGVALLTVETHVWTSPGDPAVEGVGERPGPRFEGWWPEALHRHLADLFTTVEVFGSLASGATVLAW